MKKMLISLLFVSSFISASEEQNNPPLFCGMSFGFLTAAVRGVKNLIFVEEEAIRKDENSDEKQDQQQGQDDEQGLILKIVCVENASVPAKKKDAQDLKEQRNLKEQDLASLVRERESDEDLERRVEEWLCCVSTTNSEQKQKED